MHGRLIGVVVGVVFGLAWGFAGASQLPEPWARGAVLAMLLIATVLIVAAVRARVSDRNSEGRTFDGRVYGISVILEMLGILIVALLLGRERLQPYVPPAIAFVVGLHFLGLWRASGERAFVWTCLGLCVVSLVATLLPQTVAVVGSGADGRLLVTGLGSALILWLACAAAALHTTPDM